VVFRGFPEEFQIFEQGPKPGKFKREYNLVTLLESLSSLA
jgi:hypothetical protein